MKTYLLVGGIALAAVLVMRGTGKAPEAFAPMAAGPAPAPVAAVPAQKKSAAKPKKAGGLFGKLKGVAKVALKNKLVKGAIVTGASVYGTPAAGAAAAAALGKVK